MLASITADYSELFENQEMSTNLQTSERGHSSEIGFGQQSGLSKSPLSSELPRSVHPHKISSTWSFTDTSCYLVHEAKAAAVPNVASVFCAPVEQVERSNPKMAIQSGELLVRCRSMLEVSSAVAPRFRVKSADFTLKGAESMQCQTGSLRTLEDASSSSFPLDPQRSVSTSTAATESTGIHMSVASLVKKRQEIEEQMIRLQVQLLESFREEWILTGVIPEGFTELQSQVIASNPKLKTTSFPFTHLLTNNQSEFNSNNKMIDKMDCALTTVNEACIAFGKPVGTTNGKPTCKDSLTSSFSSVMGDSICWSQWDETSTRTSDSLGDCAHDEARELISKRLQSLETDCAIVSQLYRAHKQRATETNRPAFRKAYKCNAQKLKEIHREKLVLEEQLRVMKLDEQSNVVSGLTRSNSLSAQSNVNRAFSLFNSSSVATPPLATLPRRRTLQFPSIKLERASAMCLAHWQQDHVESGKSNGDEETKSEMTEAVETAQTLHRPYSFLEPISSGRRCESKSDLNLSQLKRPISSPTLARPHKEEPSRNSSWSCSLEALRSDSSGQTDKKETTELMQIVASSSSLSPDAQLSPDCCSTAPQSSSVVHSSEASEVCLRRPADAELRESSIRCICSCISEHSGNCECTEDINENNELESDPSKGPQRSPASPGLKLPVTMPGKQTRRNLNPLSLLRSRNSKRGSLLNA
ncbi:hypothetical protein TcWFU_006550 [Taenia crassiceps]|uniref:Uncharacterized protein n=1 Tax=Taenia crassiceps TaxID=6207 RepID=A0ABR4QLX5_9CEST